MLGKATIFMQDVSVRQLNGLGLDDETVRVATKYRKQIEAVFVERSLAYSAMLEM